MKSPAAKSHPYTQMLFASFCFACMGAVVHGLAETMHWSVVTFGRMFFSVFLLAFVARMRGIPIVFTGPRALWIRAGAGSLGMIGNFYALTVLPISDALAIFHTIPIWIVVIRRVLYRETLGLAQWACVVGAIVGVFVSQEFSGASQWGGVVAALLGAMFAATAFVSMSFLGEFHPHSVALHFSFFASLVAAVVIAISFPAGGVFVPPSVALAFGLVVPAILGSIAQVFMTSAMGRGHNVTIALIGLTQVVFAGCFDVLVWGRSFSPLKLGGFAIIAACVVGMTALRRRG